VDLEASVKGKAGNFFSRKMIIGVRAIEKNSASAAALEKYLR
jgi:hypothetical protein